MQIQTCGQLDSKDLIQLCDFMQEKISSLSLTPWITAFFALVTGVAIALITLQGNRRSQRNERRSTAQLRALMEIQDMALELRNRWRDHLRFVRAKPDSADPFPEHEQTALQGRFKTALTRIDNTYLRNAYNDWEQYAVQLFNNAWKYQEYKEEELWQLALEISGRNIRWIDS